MFGNIMRRHEAMKFAFMLCTVAMLLRMIRLVSERGLVALIWSANDLEKDRLTVSSKE